VNLEPGDDPVLDVLAQPIETLEGEVVRLNGANFASDAEVWFDDVRIAAPSVAPDGSYVEVVAPPPTMPEALVDVTVVNPDGQATQRTGHVQYLLPGFRDVTDATLPPPDALDDFSARRIAKGDLNGDGIDDLVLVSPSDAAGVSGPFGPPPSLGTLTPDPSTTTPYDIQPGEEEQFSFALSQTTLVSIVTILDSIGDTRLSLRGPDSPGLWIASNDDLPTGELSSLVAARLEAGTYYVFVSGDDPAETGTYQLELRFHDQDVPAPGTRMSRTRVLLGSAGGAFTDATDTNFPTPESAPDPFDRDVWHGSAVAIGDLDGANGPEILVAGRPPRTGISWNRSSYNDGTYRDAPALRHFVNDGGGSFTFDASGQAMALESRPSVTARDEYGYDHTVLKWYERFMGLYEGPVGFGDDTILGLDPTRRFPNDPTDVELGDLDRDGDDDVVVLFGMPTKAVSGVELDQVDFSTTPPYVPSSAVRQYSYYDYEVEEYVSVGGMEVLDNDFENGNGLRYETAKRVPLSPFADALPGFHGRDVELGDIDGDTDLDCVVTWPDPLTVSGYGRETAGAPLFFSRSYYGQYQYGDKDEYVQTASLDAPRVATRVLVNDGSGAFTDATDAWLPPPSGDEFWQGTRVKLADLDGDTDLDMVLLHESGLGPDRSTALTPFPFTVVPGTETPGVIDSPGEYEEYEITVTNTGLFLIRTRLISLPDTTLDVFGPDDPFLHAYEDDDGGFGFDSRVFQQLDPGTYRISVRAYEPYYLGTYMLLVDQVTENGPGPTVMGALRVLENQGPGTGFVDVTATAIPAVTPEDNHRGDALLVHDLDDDGNLDICIATTDPLQNAGPLRSTRVFLGDGALGFAPADPDFLPDVAADTGEAHDMLIGDVAGDPTLFLVTERMPRTSPGGTHLRAQSR
jgi:hypothetical protein